METAVAQNGYCCSRRRMVYTWMMWLWLLLLPLTKLFTDVLLACSFSENTRAQGKDGQTKRIPTSNETKRNERTNDVQKPRSSSTRKDTETANNKNTKKKRRKAKNPKILEQSIPKPQIQDEIKGLRPPKTPRPPRHANIRKKRKQEKEDPAYHTSASHMTR